MQIPAANPKNPGRRWGACEKDAKRNGARAKKNTRAGDCSYKSSPDLSKNVFDRIVVKWAIWSDPDRKPNVEIAGEIDPL